MFDSRPGFDIADEVIEAPLHVDSKRRRGQVGIGKGDGPILLVDIPPLLIPIRADDVLVESGDHRVESGREPRPVIADDGQDALGFEGPVSLGIKGVEIEPVDGLGDGDQVKAMIGKVGMFGGLDGIMDIGKNDGVVELLPADIGGLYDLKGGRQPLGDLAVAGAAIPGLFFSWRQAQQVIKKRIGVSRPELGVFIGPGGEIVFHHRFIMD